MIDNSISFPYVPKVYHAWIYYEDGKWTWLPYAPNSHKEICDTIKSKEYYVSPEQLSWHITNAKRIVESFDKPDVTLNDVMFIRGKYGYFLAIKGYYKPINIKKEISLD